MNNFNVTYRGEDYLLNQTTLPSFISLVKVDAWLRALAACALFLLVALGLLLLLSGAGNLEQSADAKREPAKIELQFEAQVEPKPSGVTINQI